MSAISIREVQRKLYGGQEGPPILPHGDDLEVIQERRFAKKRRKLSTKSARENVKATPTYAARGSAPLNAAAAAFGSPTFLSTALSTARKTEPSTWIDPLEEEKIHAMFPASDLPAGFPPELAYRALAAYATIRTLSLKLRLSPFTPVVFLRALNLPVPTRLLGHVHVALLRLLLPHLGQHYHWGAAVPHAATSASQLRRFPWLHHSKKRKIDGLRWPLRAGDDLEFLDPFTWPLFLDDYAHLTADQLYWCSTGPPLDEMNRNRDDPKDNPNVWRNLDVSDVPDDWVDPNEDWRERRNPKVPSMSVLYLNDPGAGDDDSDNDEAPFVNKDEDEEFDLAEVVEEDEPKKSRKRGRPRKSDTLVAKPATKPEENHLHTSKAMKTANTELPTQTQIASFPNTLTVSTTNPVATGQPPAVAATGMMNAPFHAAAFAKMQQHAAFSIMSQQPGTTMQASPAALLMQQQIQAQINSATMAAMMASVRPGSTPGASGVQNRMSQRALPTAGMPTGPQFRKSYIATSKQIDPKLAAAANTLEKYIYGSEAGEQVQILADNVGPRRNHDNGENGASKTNNGPTDIVEVESQATTCDTTSDQTRGKHSREGSRKDEQLAESRSSVKREDSTEQGVVEPAIVAVDEVQDQVPSKKSKTTQDTGNTPMNDAEEEENDGDDEHSVEAPFVWSHFEALRELRHGKAYHELSIERKLDILEYLIDEVLTLETIRDEMSFRYTSKEQYDHPYGDLPKAEELEDLENDDNCAVCLGDGDLLCCDGCPSSYHQKCIGLPENEELPEGKWYCPECALVDPAKFGPLREGPKSSVDWFHLRDVCRSQKHLLSLSNQTDGATTEAMADDNEYLVIHGFVFRRPGSAKLSLNPLESPKAPRPLSKVDLCGFNDVVGSEDLRRWPLSQIPKKDVGLAYLGEMSSFDPNMLSNKYRMVLPLFVPKRLNNGLLKTVEEDCGRMHSSFVSDLLSSNMKSDSRLFERLASLGYPLLEVNMCIQYAKSLQQKFHRALLFRATHYFWATEFFLPMLARVRTIKAASRALVHLIDAVHPRAFEAEWFESPSHSHKRAAMVDWRKKPTNVKLCEDSTPANEVLRRYWQCMQPSSVTCALSKKLVQPQEWIREIRPDLAIPLSPQKNKRKRENQHVKLPTSFRGMVHFNTERAPDLSEAKKADDDKPNEDGVEEEDEGYHFRRSRYEKHTETDEPRKESIASVEKYIDKEKEKLVSFILGVTNDIWIQEPSWPVAGRRLFEPTGNLSKRETRRLARRAGSVRAPFVVYSQDYEVGQASCYQIWRKQMLACSSFEDLLLGMRTLAAFIESDTIRQATTAARKYAKKATAKCDVYCSCVDLSTGEENYLVLDRNGSSGTWVSARTVDIKVLVSFQSKRIAELESKKRAELLKKSARKVRPKSQEAPPPRTFSSQAAGNQGGVSGLPSNAKEIMEFHNQNILRLFWIHPNSMGAEFLRDRQKLRASTTSTLSLSLKTIGVSLDSSQANTFLAESEKAFLEGMKPKYPSVLKNFRDLYPENIAERFPPAETGAARTSEKKPLVGSGKRRDYRCRRCGQTGHNQKTCPSLSTSGQQALVAPPPVAGSSVGVVSSHAPNSKASKDPQPAFNGNQNRFSAATMASSSHAQMFSLDGSGQQHWSPPANIDPEVWRQYLASQTAPTSRTTSRTAPRSGQTPNGAPSTGTYETAQFNSIGGGGRPTPMQMDTSTRSGVESISLGNMTAHQQRTGATGVVGGSIFPGQQLQGQFLHQRTPPNFQSSTSANAAQSLRLLNNQQQANQNQHSYQMRGAVSGLVGTVLQNQHQSFSTDHMQKPSPSSPNTPNFQQGGFTQNRGGDRGASSTNSSQFFNNFIPNDSNNNDNANIFPNLLGMNHPGNAVSPYASNAAVQHNSSSGVFPNHSQQQTRSPPTMHGQNEMANYAAQFDGLEPTPIRTTLRHGDADVQSQHPVNFGSPSFIQTQSNADANDLSETFAQDFFSPTPIHPNHQHRVTSKQQQQPPSGMNPRQAFPSSGSGQPFQGFNNYNTGQFSNHQR